MSFKYEWDAQKAESNLEKHGDLLPHYDFDYSKAKPNRFAGIKEGSLLVVLEPDIAEVFKTPESVASVLRALIKTMPSK